MANLLHKPFFYRSADGYNRHSIPGWV